MDDHQAIHQLAARYNRSFDDRDVDGWVDCFTPDARSEFVGAGRVIEGQAALRGASARGGSPMSERAA